MGGVRLWRHTRDIHDASLHQHTGGGRGCCSPSRRGPGKRTSTEQPPPTDQPANNPNAPHIVFIDCFSQAAIFPPVVCQDCGPYYDQNGRQAYAQGLITDALLDRALTRQFGFLIQDRLLRLQLSAVSPVRNQQSEHGEEPACSAHCRTSKYCTAEERAVRAAHTSRRQIDSSYRTQRRSAATRHDISHFTRSSLLLPAHTAACISSCTVQL